MYDRPILYYTLECIESIEWIEEIVVPVAAEKLDWLQQQRDVWRLHKTRFVVGGEARHQSIFEGLNSYPNKEICIRMHACMCVCVCA